MKRATCLAMISMVFLVSVASAQVLTATVAWVDQSVDETGFRVEKKIGAGTYAVLATTAANITSITDTAVSLSTNYCYRVQSFNNFGSSAYGPEACGSASAPAAPGATTVIFSVQ